MSRSRMLRLGWGWVVVAGAATAAARAEVPAAAKLVGPEAVVYLEVGRPSELIDRLTGDRFGALLDATPAFAEALRKDDFRKFRAVVDLVAAKLGTTWPQTARDLTGGGLILAAGGEKAERVVLIATPTNPDLLTKAYAALLDMARQDATNNGRPDPVREVAHRGATLYLVGPTSAYVLLDGRLILSNSESHLRAVVDRARDGAPSIADDQGWKDRRAQVDEKATAWAYARLDRLREIDPKKYGGDGPGPAPVQLLFGQWIEALRKSPWAAASLTWEGVGFSADLTVATPPGGYSRAVKAFLPARGEGAPAPLVPPRMILSVGGWRDLAALWEVRNELLKPEDAENLTKAEPVFGLLFGGRDFGTGILPNLGRDWRLVVAGQDVKELDPVPDVKLPAFAFVVGFKADDDEFAQQLKGMFQTLIGLVNLGAAQEKSPVFLLGSEVVEGETVAVARYSTSKKDRPKGPVHQRYNFSPSSAVVNDHFILSSSAGLARDLVRALKAQPAAPALAPPAGTVAVADGGELAALLERDRAALVAKNMLDKGNDKAKAEGEINFLLSLLRMLGPGSLTARDADHSVRFEVDLGGAAPAIED